MSYNKRALLFSVLLDLIVFVIIIIIWFHCPLNRNASWRALMAPISCFLDLSNISNQPAHWPIAYIITIIWILCASYILSALVSAYESLRKKYTKTEVKALEPIFVFPITTKKQARNWIVLFVTLCLLAPLWIYVMKHFIIIKQYHGYMDC